jgi:hypothetical protein
LCEEVESRKQREQELDRSFLSAPSDREKASSLFPMLAGASVAIGVIVFAVMTTVRARPPATPCSSFSSPIASERPAVALVRGLGDAPPGDEAPSEPRVVDPNLLPTAGPEPRAWRRGLLQSSNESSVLPVEPSDADAPAADVAAASASEECDAGLAEAVTVDAAADDALPGAEAAATGPSGECATSADGRTSVVISLPETPTQARVQAALSVVREDARVCVAGLDEACRATITFESSGEVTSVLVVGSATGTLVERCIRSALGRARVPPFRRPTFSVGLTIQP